MRRSATGRSATRATTWAVLSALTALFPAAGLAQMESTPLISHRADAALLKKVLGAIAARSALQKAALVFPPLSASAAEGEGFILVPAATGGSAGENGRLLAVLFDGCHLEPENVVTVRLASTGAGAWQGARVAFGTLAQEGEGAPRKVHAPNASWTAALTPMVALPEPVAAKLTALGGTKLGAMTSPQGVDVILAETEHGRTAGVAFRLPTRAELASHGATWCRNAAR